MVWGTGPACVGCLLCPVAPRVRPRAPRSAIGSLKSHHWGSTPSGISSRGEHPGGPPWRGRSLPLPHPLLMSHPETSWSLGLLQAGAPLPGQA